MALIHDAAKKGEIKLLKNLLGKGSDINLVDQYGYTPLLWACLNGHDKAVRYLIKKKAKVNYSRDRLRPIHAAAIAGNLKILRMLLKCGVGVDTTVEGDRTPLHWAAQEGQPDAANLLIKYGANVNKLNDYETPLSIAVGEGNMDIVKLLLQNRVAVNRYHKNVALLQHACAWNRIDIVKLLLKHGAKINTRDKGGETPIFYAVRYGHIDLVKLLIQKGADLKVTNNRGHSLEYYAKRKSKIQVLLKEKRINGIKKKKEKAGPGTNKVKPKNKF